MDNETISHKTKRSRKISLLRRLSTEFGPLLIFFFFLKTQGIYIATAVFMAATLSATAVSWQAERRLPVVPLISTGLAIIFGSLTLALDDPFFIKVRPTVFNFLGALVLLGGLMRGHLVLSSIFGDVINLEPSCWRALTIRLALYLICLGTLNEFVWRFYPTEVWGTFKAFATPTLNLIFLASQWPFIRLHRRRQLAIKKPGEKPGLKNTGT